MNNVKFFISLVLAVSILIVQVGGVFAAPAAQDSTAVIGRVHRITLDTDANTGTTTVLVELVGQGQGKQIVRISQTTAISLGLVVLDLDGPVINEHALGTLIEIDPGSVIPDQERNPHPVGNALATFFADIEELDYDTIMDAHAEGIGFGTIAQALWLTLKLEGDSGLFQQILDAKEKNDYGELSQYLDEDAVPTNWGQFRKAILSREKKDSLGDVMSANDENSQDNNQDKNKNRNSNGNQGNQDKDKHKEKDKNK